MKSLIFRPAFIVATFGGAAKRKTPALCDGGDIVATLSVCGSANHAANLKTRRKSLYIVATSRRAANRAANREPQTANRKPLHCSLSLNLSIAKLIQRLPNRKMKRVLLFQALTPLNNFVLCGRRKNYCKRNYPSHYYRLLKYAYIY